jgi:hypothetical protein
MRVDLTSSAKSGGVAAAERRFDAGFRFAFAVPLVLISLFAAIGVGKSAIRSGDVAIAADERETRRGETSRAGAGGPEALSSSARETAGMATLASAHFY